ncbi:unnamed protein product [Caenorhabditis sp. 36 PRJEB53466]|nr:unnamed protein product [Caenorhabditis sp. 36 PRJEB53466]
MLQKLEKLPYSTINRKLSEVDSQPLQDESILVTTIGQFRGRSLKMKLKQKILQGINDDAFHSFSHSFFLRSNDG